MDDRISADASISALKSDVTRKKHFILFLQKRNVTYANVS